LAKETNQNDNRSHDSLSQPDFCLPQNINENSLFLDELPSTCLGDRMVRSPRPQHTDGSTGGCIVVLQTLVFVIAMIFAPKHGLLVRARKPSTELP